MTPKELQDWIALIDKRVSDLEATVTALSVDVMNLDHKQEGTTN